MLTQTPDALQLLQDIAKAHGETQATEHLLKVRRDELRRELQRGRDAGLTLAQIAELLGVSRQRVDQMLRRPA